MKINNKNIIITGGGSEIVRALANKFWKCEERVNRNS
jgi:short-subunit dehydrogenase involved in D-alanine esterification of teichoic acids|tara:strand:- start:143 stop:253 length:111 start_codon:yes stop_codon:yes gene_type:complete